MYHSWQSLSHKYFFEIAWLLWSNSYCCLQSFSHKYQLSILWNCMVTLKQLFYCCHICFWNTAHVPPVLQQASAFGTRASLSLTFDDLLWPIIIIIVVCVISSYRDSLQISLRKGLFASQSMESHATFGDAPRRSTQVNQSFTKSLLLTLQMPKRYVAWGWPHWALNILVSFFIFLVSFGTSQRG